MPFLLENAARIAAWLPPVFIAVGVGASLALVYERMRPGRIRNWQSVVARNALTLSIVGLGVAYIPMPPLFRSAEKLQAKRGAAFPELEFKLVADGSSHRLSEYKGSVVLINLWATWCGPCREEMPTLNRLQQQYRDRGVVVLTLSDQPAEEVVGFLRRRAPDTLNARVESFGWLAVRDFRPWTLVLDRDGKLRDYLFGAQSYEVFEKKVRALL